jgi:hypothetical protein
VQQFQPLWSHFGIEVGDARSDGPLQAPDAWEAWMREHKDAFAVELAEEFR